MPFFFVCFVEGDGCDLHLHYYVTVLSFSCLYLLVVFTPVPSSDSDGGVDRVLREGWAVSVSVRVQERRRDQHGVLRR